MPSLKHVSLCLGVVWWSLGELAHFWTSGQLSEGFESALLIRKQDEVVTVIAHRIQSHTEELLKGKSL